MVEKVLGKMCPRCGVADGNVLANIESRSSELWEGKCLTTDAVTSKNIGRRLAVGRPKRAVTRGHRWCEFLSILQREGIA